MPRANARTSRPAPRGQNAPEPARFPVRTAIVFALLAVTLFWWHGTPPQAGATPGGALVAIAELTGLIASVLVCAQLLLVARVPWFERDAHAVSPDAARHRRRVGEGRSRRGYRRDGGGRRRRGSEPPVRTKCAHPDDGSRSRQGEKKPEARRAAQHGIPRGDSTVTEG